MSTYEQITSQLKNRPRTWLITGVAGFIGSNLLETLLGVGQRVIGLDNLVSGHRKNLDEVRTSVTAEQWGRFQFVEGDIATLPWPEATFDAVLDSLCLACLTEAETAAVLAQVHRVLKPGGAHFSLLPKSGCWGDGTGARLDATTIAEASEGPFRQLGKTRFATEESIRRLYAQFRDLALEYEIRSAENRTREVSHWVITCRK